MSYQYAIVAMLLVSIGCVSSVSLRACEVNLLVRNISSNTILAVEYREHESDTWSDNLILSQIGPNNLQKVHWRGDGYYEIGIRFTSSKQPQLIPAQNLCNRSELIAGSGGFLIR
jgi:hypothetical protein